MERHGRRAKSFTNVWELRSQIKGEIDSNAAKA
jgi:hypothetical protein